jgi:WD40 repeat protein
MRNSSESLPTAEHGRPGLPLPKSEGRGEGERRIRIAIRIPNSAIRTPHSLLLCAALLVSLSSPAQEKITYQDHVLPLIENNCAKCHNADKKKGDLDLTTYNGLLKGGGSGQVVTSGNADSSKLVKAITHAEEPTMPPNKPRLPDKEIDVFKKWIAGGLLETSGSKAIVSKPSVDLTLKVGAVGKPEGPPPMPKELPLEPVVQTTHASAVTGLASSPWAPVIAVAGQKQILVYNSDSLELMGILPFTEGFPFDVRFSRSGKLLLASGGRGGKSGRVSVWDVVTGKQVVTIGNEYDTILSADISPDQTKIAFGGPTRLVKICSTKDGELIHKMKKHTDWVNAVAFSPNGEMLASADRNGGITVWDAENGQELYTLAGHKVSATALSWRGDSRLLASSSEDGAIKLWDLDTGKQAKTWAAHSGGALWVNYTHDGRLVSCGRDNQIITWEGSGSKLKAMEYSGELPTRATFSHDGGRVFGADFNGHLIAWNTKDGKKLRELEAKPSAGKQLSSASEPSADVAQK